MPPLFSLPDSVPPSISDLRMADVADLLHNFKLENCDYKLFVPFPKLQVLFTREKLLELVQQCDLKFYIVEEIINRVLEGGLRTFATLAAIRNIESMEKFIKTDHYSGSPLDAKLPLDQADLPKYFSNQNKGEQFYHEQWTYLAPVFSENQSHRELDNRVVLPFLDKTRVGKGGFAKVYKVKVDASHHRLKFGQAGVSEFTILESAHY